MTVVHSAFGLAVFVGLAWLLSENRARVQWRTVIAGLALQLVLAVILLKLPASREVFIAINNVLLSLEQATRAGTSFVFGFLGGAPLPFEESYVGASFVLAFRALPLVMVASALSALLFYWRILPAVVKAFSRVLQKTMNIGGTVGIGAAANIFVGMVEAPLFVRPYLKEVSRGELFMIMSCGMATIAGTVMILYATILRDVIPDALGHLLVASIISAPAAIVIAALMVPAEGAPSAGDILPEPAAEGSMDAITKGTLQGVQLLLNIIAMLIVLVALVSLVNQALALLPAWGNEAITLQRVLGYLLAPLAWLMGISWSETLTAGALMGTKTVLNELIAYTELARLPPDSLSERTRLILTYAMCGFANPGSLGIMIGGLATMCPERRGEIVQLGMKSILAGLQAARGQALQRNARVQFLLMNEAVDPGNVGGFVANTTGPAWAVRIWLPNNSYEFLEGREALEGSNQASGASSRVAIAATSLPAATMITFNAVGQTDIAAGQVARYDITHPLAASEDRFKCQPTGEMRCLRVEVSPGGRVRMCDPAVTDATDTRYCTP